MRLLLLCSLPVVTSSAFAAPTPDHFKTLKPLPALTESQLQAALKRIDTFTQALIESAHVPGISLTIVKDDKVVWLKGYGFRNLEKKLPMTPDTVTCIASCSKAFTSTLALMAVQDGKLSLDDPVRRHLPYFHLMDPTADAGMTVADLMCHSSGLPRTDMAWPTEQLDAKACVQLLTNCQPTFLFRENAQYSNILVNTASMVTSAVYDTPWPELLKEKIAGPLGMPSTSASLAKDIDPSRMSKGYWFNPASGQVERERYLEGQEILGAGAVKSTARDLSRWLRFHLGQGTLEGKKILRSDLLAEAYRPRQRASDNTGFGLGWYIDERWSAPVIEHGGDLPGFQSLVCLVPSKHLGIAFSDNNDAAGIRSILLSKILSNFLGDTDHIWETQPAKEAGTFVDPGASQLLRISYDGALWAKLDQGKAIRLTRTGWRSYETADSRNPILKLKFSDDPSDKKHPSVSLADVSGTTIYQNSVKFNAGISIAGLMEKSVEAYGGKDNLSKPFNITGRYQSDQLQEGVHINGLLIRSNNDLGFLQLMHAGGCYLATALQGVNVASAGSVETNFHADYIYGADLVDAQLDAEVCQAVGWKQQFAKVDIVARQNLNGEPVWVVRKAPKNSPNEILDFVSEKTGLVLRREVGNPATTTLFGDFRATNGVMLPHQLTFIDSTFHVEVAQVGDFVTVDRYPHWAFNPIGTAKVSVDQ